MLQDSGQRREFSTGAVRDIEVGKGRFDLISPFALQRIARHYEAGALKYSDRNWEKGIPYHSLVDSALRHLMKFIMRWKDEDHLAAAAWNIIAILHFEEIGRKELDDLPTYETINNI